MVRFTFRDMMFNHGISCDIGSGKRSIQKDLSKKMTLEQNDIELSERQVIDVSRERRLQVPKQVYLLW